MWTALKNQLAGRFSNPEARVLCYVMGPVSGGMMLFLRHYGEVWSVRFHAFHSMFMGALWAVTWVAMRLAEAISPSWFGAVAMSELRFAVNMGFVAVWAVLLVTAYGGGRCAPVPYVHTLAVRLARRSQRAVGVRAAGVRGA